MNSFLREKSVSLIGRLTRIEQVNSDNLVRHKAARIGFEFDAINREISEQTALDEISGKRDGANLALVKVLTTYDRLCKITGRNEFEEGDWFLIQLGPRGNSSGSFAWASALETAGYLENIPLSLENATWMFRDEDPFLRPLSSGITALRSMVQNIASACKFPSTAIYKRNDIQNLLTNLSVADHAIVHDVGQGSFITLMDANNNEVVHLDAGWPVSWNMKTAPKTKPCIKNCSAPVVISHWDWDHIHGYHAIRGLRSGIWIVPVQKLGPGAKRIAETLSKSNRLYGMSSTFLSAGKFKLYRKKRKNFNNSGILMEASLNSGKKILYVGDSDYLSSTSPLTVNPDLLVATHHGAKFNGSVPLPTSYLAPCVVSVGAGNTYKHPSQAALQLHRSAGWQLSYTCQDGLIPRGQKRLGP